MIRVLQQADSSQRSLVTQQVQHIPGYLDILCLYYAAIQNLVYGCGNVPQTIAESSDTLPTHYGQHVQQSINMSIQLPTSLQWSMGVGMFHRPSLKAATHYRHIVANMCNNPSMCPSSFPQAYNLTLFKCLKLFNRNTYHWQGMVVP